MNINRETVPFNSPLETGVRALAVLSAIYPTSLDLQRLVDFDYLIVHSADIGGPESLHAPLPMRTGEVLVRRGLIEAGLALMMSRGLVRRTATSNGIQYVASDSASPFLGALTSPYMTKLRARAGWISDNFGRLGYEELHQAIRRVRDEWATQFQSIETLSAGQS